MNNTTTFEDAQIGDRVWSLTSGWGEITEIVKDSTYPLTVSYSVSEPLSYTFGGYEFEDDLSRTLFWDEVKIKAPRKPLPDLKVNAKVLVWNDPEYKYKRYFSHFDEKGRVHAFYHGKTSWTTGQTSPWRFWELAE